MFLSLEQPIVISLIAVIAVQYAFATFCLMKLATLDLSRKNYILWNVFILLVFFVGDIAFLIYYFKAGKSKRIPDFVPTSDVAEQKPDPDGEETIDDGDGVAIDKELGDGEGGTVESADSDGEQGESAGGDTPQEHSDIDGESDSEQTQSDGE